MKRTAYRASLAVSTSLALLACAGDPAVIGTADAVRGGSGKADGTEIPADWNRLIAHTRLEIDFGAMSGLATIVFEPSDSGLASFEAGGLEVLEVYSDLGALPFERREGNLHVETGPGDAPIHIRYRFEVQTSSTGLGPAGSTVIWPTYCGNLFPCHSDPADGLTFELAVTGLPEESVALFPEAITTTTPAYTLAFAIGEYTCQVLGTTSAETEVSVCWLPRGKTRALAGTKHLTPVFDWFETHLGPYAFGDRVASVAADWGDAAAGGMEHHPYWHVATSEMDLPITHAHEAAHGWFGAGVRIGCWEDLVLSEGTVSYLAARALGAVKGPDVEAAQWEEYAEELRVALEDTDDIVWPDSCGEVDLLEDGLWSNVLYMKGAFFYRDVAAAIGADVLDTVFASFYLEYVGEAARMQDMLDHIESETGFDPSELATRWLRSTGNPLDGPTGSSTESESDEPR